MKQQKLKLECVKYAAKVVATMNVENKSKALFDLAEQIEKWVNEEQQKQPDWFGLPIYPYQVSPTIIPPYEVTCTGGTSTTDGIIDALREDGSVSYSNKQKE